MANAVIDKLMESLGKSVEGIFGRLASTLARSHQTGGGGGGGGGGNATIGALTAALGPLGAAFGGLSEAVGGLQQQFNSLIGAVTPFVQAFNPSAVEALNLAMYDLQAVIGLALTPIVQTATDALKEIGAILLPIAEKLQPIIAQLASVLSAQLMLAVESIAGTFTALLPAVQALVTVFGALGELNRAYMALFAAVLIPTAKAVGAVFQFLQPVIELVAAAFKGVADLSEALMTVFQTIAETVIEAIAAFVPALDLKDVTNSLKDAFKQVTKGAIVAAAALARLLGAEGFIKNLKKNLAGPVKKSAVGLGAAKNARTSTFEDLGKQLALAASVASGTGEKKDEEKTWREDALEALNGLPDRESLKSILSDIADDLAEQIIDWFKERLPTPAGLKHGADEAVFKTLGGGRIAGAVAAGGRKIEGAISAIGNLLG